MFFLQRAYDLAELHDTIVRLKNNDTIREKYDSAIKPEQIEIERVVEMLARYIEAGKAPFDILPESSPKQADPEEGEYKLSMIIPKGQAGIDYWNACVHMLTNEKAQKILLLRQTPNGYKTLDMINGSTEQVM